MLSYFVCVFCCSCGCQATNVWPESEPVAATDLDASPWQAEAIVSRPTGRQSLQAKDKVCPVDIPSVVVKHDM